MLNPNNDRLDYGSILSAPANYELDFAIGTTYSLDLDSLVGASIALGLSEETDTVLKENPIFLLEALRSTGDKIALFCENGRIALPRNITQLYILLEEMVFQVNNPNVIKTKYASFHPKFWLVRYVNENEEVIYRVIVLSRNLTFDRNWDISFYMDGKKVENSTESIKNKNKNLTIFLDYLKEFSIGSDKKINKIDEIIKELDFVEFHLNNNTFEDFDFIPNGVSDDVSIENYPLFKEDFDDLVIITPFLSKNVIKDFNQRAKENQSYQNSKIDGESRVYLFTRVESLSSLTNDSCDEFKIYTLKDQIIDGESAISEESNDSDESGLEVNQVLYQHQDIHAKIYFVRRGAQVDLYLGSLNASHNALKGNVEFMIHLKTNYRKFNLNKFLNDLFCGEEGGSESPFQLVEDINKYIGGEGSDEDNDLDSILKDVARLNFKSKITFDDEFYKINLNVDNFSDFENEHNMGDFNISIKPLLSEKIEKLSQNMSFEKLNKIQLSTFFVITVKKSEESINRVIKIETEGMPDDRDKDVISSIVTDKTAFIRYVAFLLGEDSISSLPPSGTEDDGEGPDSTQLTHVQLPALYEKMLDAAIDHQDKFREVEYLIQTLSDDNVIPEGFEELYNIFKGVIDNEQSK